jgi:hypothetical protein
VPYSKTAPLFNICDGTMTKITNVMLNFFNEIAHKFIKFPRTAAEKQKVANDFYEVNFFLLKI